MDVDLTCLAGHEGTQEKLALHHYSFFFFYLLI